MESFNTGFGGGIRLRVSKVPISISYRNEKIDQREQQTNRNYLTYRENLNANSEFSLSQSDKNRIVFNYDDFDRKYYSSSRIRAKISTINFNSNVNFDTNYVNRLNTNINYSINNGNTNYERVLVNENLNLELQNNFIYSGNYSYFNFAQQDISTKQHTIVNRIEHQLYESLKSNIFYEYTNSSLKLGEEALAIQKKYRVEY